MDQNIVVIGASRGIGRASALALARAGRHLALAARDQTALEEVGPAAQSSRRLRRWRWPIGRRRCGPG
jgi:short-subunit dehydrogenase